MNLQQRIDQQIETQKPGFEMIPGAVIIHDIHKQTVVYMSQWGLNILGVTLQELDEMGTDYYPRFFNMEEAKDYVPRVFGLVQRNNDDELLNYFQQVRTTSDPEWKLYLTSTKIFMRDDEGMPLLTLTTATPIDEKHSVANKIERLLEENNFLRQKQHLFASMTKREKEIVALMAIGKNSAEMAAHFSLSEDTVKTHRRNIKKKLAAENHYDIVRFAQAFDLL